jgi:serine protease Do
MHTTSHLSLFRRACLGSVILLAAAGLVAAAGPVKSGASGLVLKRDSQPVTRGPLEASSFSDIVKRVAPSVVKITVQMSARGVSLNQGEDGSPFPGFDDPTLRQFFGNRLPAVPQAPESGLGSGVIVSRDGYIVTNNHVVAEAREVMVTLADGRELRARVVGRDPQTDVALIKVSANDLPAITFASSAKVEVGDRVLAIGNPFGIGETVTTGIVSATGRQAGLGLAYEDFIQTDAAINPGNSGGALVDIEGRLVGINTAILSRSGGFQGVGLAVPADLVGNVVDNLAAHGKVVRGYLGIEIQDLTPALAESFGLKTAGGALISDVQPDRAGARAGLRSGDVITAVDGQPVDSAGHFSLTVGETAPGTRLMLDVVRAGKTERIAVTTMSKPGERDDSDALAAAAGDDQGVLNGVGVADLDADARRQLNLPDRLSGVLVTAVEPGSASARAGLREGDVILEIDRHAVDSAKSAVDLSASATQRRTLLKIWSHKNFSFLVVDETKSDSADGGS